MASLHVRRRVKSCALCRKRKVKCDVSSQQCSNCTNAGVTCVGLDPITKQTTPRSLVQWLETEIAALEQGKNGITPSSDGSRLLDDHGSVSLLASDSYRPVAPSLERTVRPSSRSPLLDFVAKDMTCPWLGLSKKVPLAEFVMFSGTQIPSTEPQFGVPGTDDGSSRSILHPFSNSNPLTSIPKTVADFLLENYISRSFPSYPMYHEPWLRSCHNAVFHNSESGAEAGSLASPYQIYTARANRIALELFEHASRRMPDVLMNDISGLQALLLLHQYNIMNPTAANIYFLCGYIMQTCIDLGLHQEDPDTTTIDCLARDMKRRIFWCAWEMDAACNLTFSRSVSLLPKYITTHFPSEMEDAAISPHGIHQSARPVKLNCARIRVFRLIESEIVSILFHDEPLPSTFPSLDAWMSDIETRIHTWSQDVYHSASANQDSTMNAQWSEMTLYADIADPLIIVTLFRPCPKIKAPSTTNLMKAFAAAVKVADGYYQQANKEFGSPKYTFHPCHHVFSSAMVFLHALRCCKAAISSYFTLKEVQEFMSRFSRFFSTTAERWPAAARCLEEYERLLTPLRDEYVEFALQNDCLVSPAGATAATSTATHFEDMLGFQDIATSTEPPSDATFYVNSLFDSFDVPDPEEFPTPYSAMPSDWNAEFDFGMHGAFDWTA